MAREDVAVKLDWPKLESVAEQAGARAQQIEELRRLPEDLAADLVATNVFRLWIPRRYGGIEGRVGDLLDAIEQVAYHDGSTGWCVMIGGTSALVAAYLEPSWAHEIFGDPLSVTGGYAMPAGSATPVPGGLRVRGRWSWGSGTLHCTWIGAGVRIVDASGAPTSLADGTRGAYVLVPPQDVRFLDTWKVSGLKGTGSTDYEIQDAFVPEGRWGNFLRAEPIVDAPLYRISFTGALAAGVASVTIGLARRAIDELEALHDKVPTGSSRSLAERPVAQAQIARAEAAMLSSRSFLREVLEAASARAARGLPFSDENRRLLRLAATNAGLRCAEAVDLCYHAAGGSSIWESNALQRVFRDVHVATQHGMIADRTLEPLGRMRFGLPTDTQQL